MIGAMGSGSGKTVVTCGLLAAMKRRGLDARAFKCGPDYIDPMFHSRVLGVPSRNLDLFLQGEAGVRGTMARHGGAWNLLESAMGYYDGLGGTDQASGWQVARTVGAPVLLVLRPRGASLTLAAQVRGMMDFRQDSGIAGLLLNDCGEGMYRHLAPILQNETGLPVLGFLPPMEQARLDSRHLGLLTAGEIRDLGGRLEAVADQLEQTVQLDRLLELAGHGPDSSSEQAGPEPAGGCIAVARDEAFCFFYADNLDALARAGARLVPFSPLRDEGLPPEASGLYLGGGYPEVYAEALSRNRAMRQSILAAVEAGMPTVAECGGFLYLQRTLEDEQGRPWPMVGGLPGAGIKTSRLQRFGYLTLAAEEDSLLFRAGERIPAHEFHYWDCTENGTDLTAEKPLRPGSWRCGWATPRLYAAFPHLHFGGDLPLAERFAAAAACWEGRI